MIKYLVVALIALAGVALYFYAKPAPAPPGVYLPAITAPVIAKVPKAEVAVAVPLRVYAPKAKSKLNLPDVVQQDPVQHVAASTKTANDERIHTITTVVDASTGEFTTLDRVEPQPWVAVQTKSNIGVYYGIKQGGTVIRLQGHQELLQLKAARIGLTATLDSDGTYFAGIGASVRW